MLEYIIIMVLGAFIGVMGIINMTGNLSTLHWYHRQRVTEENRKPFGRLAGGGTLIIGISMIVTGILFWLSEKIGLEWLFGIGTGVLIVGFVVGLGLSFFAMFKYNKGIF